MAASKRLRQSSSKPTNESIEKSWTSNRTVRHELSGVNEGLRFERRTNFAKNHSETSSKSTIKETLKTFVDETQTSSEEDWVCPVAVALRRAGYDVPLRPSRSWLERDRKHQAMLRQRQTSTKEI